MQKYPNRIVTPCSHLGHAIFSVVRGLGTLESRLNKIILTLRNLKIERYVLVSHTSHGILKGQTIIFQGGEGLQFPKEPSKQ